MIGTARAAGPTAGATIPPVRPRDLPALTGLRFVAATSVFVHHLIGVLWLDEGAVGSANLGMAVSLFFVLSGFVLAHAYAHRPPDRYPVRFATQRFLRIWPAHAAVFVFSVFLFWPDGTRWIRTNFSSLELVQMLMLGQAWSSDARIFWGVNAVAWSISVEAFFYVLFPALVWIGRRSVRALVVTGIGSAAVWLVLTTSIVTVDAPFEALGWGAIMPVPRLAEFILGMLTHRLFAHRPMLLPATRATAVEFAALLGSVAAIVWATPLADRFFDSNTILHAWTRETAGAPAFALLIAALAVGGGRLSHLLSTRLGQWLGRISFAEYLIHQRLIVYWQRKVVPLEWPIWFEVASLVATVLIASSLIHRFIEMPGVRLGRRMTATPTQNSTPA